MTRPLEPGVSIWHAVSGGIRVQRRYSWISEDRTRAIYVVQQQWINEDGETEWRDVPIVDDEGEESSWD